MILNYAIIFHFHLNSIQEAFSFLQNYLRNSHQVCSKENFHIRCFNIGNYLIIISVFSSINRYFNNFLDYLLDLIFHVYLITYFDFSYFDYLIKL